MKFESPTRGVAKKELRELKHTQSKGEQYVGKHRMGQSDETKRRVNEASIKQLQEKFAALNRMMSQYKQTGVWDTAPQAFQDQKNKEIEKLQGEIDALVDEIEIINSSSSLKDLSPEVSQEMSIETLVQEYMDLPEYGQLTTMVKQSVDSGIFNTGLFKTKLSALQKRMEDLDPKNSRDQKVRQEVLGSVQEIIQEGMSEYKTPGFLKMKGLVEPILMNYSVNAKSGDMKLPGNTSRAFNVFSGGETAYTESEQISKDLTRYSDGLQRAKNEKGGLFGGRKKKVLEVLEKLGGVPESVRKQVDTGVDIDKILDEEIVKTQMNLELYKKNITLIEDYAQERNTSNLSSESFKKVADFYERSEALKLLSE